MLSHLKKLTQARMKFNPQPTQLMNDGLGGRNSEVAAYRRLSTGRQLSSLIAFKSLKDLIGTVLLFFDNFAPRQMVSEQQFCCRRTKMILGNQQRLGPSRSRRKTGGCTLAL